MSVIWIFFAVLVMTLGAAPVSAKADPFAGVAPAAVQAVPPQNAWASFQENLGIRSELMSQFAASDHAAASSRQSVGLEVLKKFSSATSTLASLNVQMRVVRRDRYIPIQNDMEGMSRPGWGFEYHNATLDLYNILNPLLNVDQRSRAIGRFNFRAGRFYVPFGLNLQTDTHGQVMQLSNEENFGFERDWYSGLWGQLNDHVNYDLHYLVGSGYHPRFDGQKGLAALRLSLANRYSFEHGLEGGVSALGGERLNEDREKIKTWRGGLDGRVRRAVPTGLATATTEWSGGRDDAASLITQLYQTEYLHHTRRWGSAVQYRRFWNGAMGADASWIGEVTWYFRNDVSSSNLHWIKLNIEKKVEASMSSRAVIYGLQYYRYW